MWQKGAAKEKGLVEEKENVTGGSGKTSGTGVLLDHILAPVPGVLIIEE